MAKNIHRYVLDLAKKKYGNDVSISKMVLHCRNYMTAMTFYKKSHDPLQGYKKGLAGEDGYTATMRSMNVDVLKLPLQQMIILIQFTAVFDVLVTSLQALGEDIEY